MRTVIRGVFLTTLALFLLDLSFGWITIPNRTVLVVAGIAFYLLNTIGRPILKLLWLPINIITLGLFSWVLNIAVVFLVTLFIPGFHLDPASFSAFRIGHFLIPAIHLTLFWTYFLFSFILSWTEGILRWLLVEG